MNPRLETARLQVLPLILACALAPAATAGWSYLEQAAINSQAQFGGNSGFGHAVDIDGDTLAIGVPHPGAGGVGGHTVVYRRTAGSWVQEADLVPSDSATADYFGWAVALQGDVLVVGAIGQDVGGAAYVFRRSGATWTEEQRLLASDPVQGAEFGHSVAVHGSTVLVGAPQATYASYGGRGACYVFEELGSTWSQVDKLAGGGTVWGARNGSSVAIDGDRLVIGARTTHEDNGQTIGTGSGYVFVRAGGSWTEEAKLQAASYQAWAVLGCSAAIEGTRIVLGAEGEGFNTGAAYVFEKSGAAWVQKDRLTGAGTDPGDWFGHAVDLSGNRVVVGTYNYDNPKPSGFGAAKLFAWDGSSWTERLELLGTAMTVGDTLGESVAIQGDVVVGGSPSYAAGQVGKAWIWQVAPAPAEPYCTAKPNSLGCTPAIGFTGTPSATSPAPFLVTAGQVLSQKQGLLFYGYAPQATPFAGGTKCVATPIRRTPAQSSGGNPPTDCSGTYAYDFNARIQSGLDPALVPGADVFCQYWYRDPSSQGSIGLTDALSVRIQP